jgi:tetratricopeptide (TPR) repeat protein
MSKRPVILILLYILFASLAWGQAQKPPTAPPPLSEKDKKIIALFEKAISLQRAGKPKEAIAAYQELLQLQPNTPKGISDSPPFSRSKNSGAKPRR